MTRSINQAMAGQIHAHQGILSIVIGTVSSRSAKADMICGSQAECGHNNTRLATASKRSNLCNLACHGVQHSTILPPCGQYGTPWPPATGFGHCITGSGARLSRECSPLLGLRLNFSFGFGGQLKNSGLLTFFEVRQQHDPAVREFKRIVMGYDFVLVDLPKDRGVVFDCRPAPSKQAGWKARNLTSKGQLRSGSDADRNVCIFRRRKASCAGSEVVCGELVANPCGS